MTMNLIDSCAAAAAAAEMEWQHTAREQQLLLQGGGVGCRRTTYGAGPAPLKVQLFFLHMQH